MKKIDLNSIGKEAQNYFKNEKLSCSESVLKAIVNNFDMKVDDNIVRVASGFSGGIGGCGCVCGTLSAANISIDLLFGRSEGNDPAINKAKELSKNIHDIFIEKNSSTCCKEITKGLEAESEEKFNKCYNLIGEVAYDTAKIISDELKIEY